MKFDVVESKSCLKEGTWLKDVSVWNKLFGQTVIETHVHINSWKYWNSSLFTIKSKQRSKDFGGLCHCCYKTVVALVWFWDLCEATFEDFFHVDSYEVEFFSFALQKLWTDCESSSEYTRTRTESPFRSD